MIYDVAPGQLIETRGEKILDEDELAAARKRFEKGTKLETIARSLGAHVWEPETPDPVQHVAVDYDALAAALGDDKARELAGLPPRNGV